MKLVVVGEAPSRRAEKAVEEQVRSHGSRLSNPETCRRYWLDRQACAGVCGHRLAELAGASYREYVERTERFNVLPRWPGWERNRRRGDRGKGSRFPVKEARRRASKLLDGFSDRRVLLLGRRVAAAFRVEASVPVLSWRRRFDPDDGHFWTFAVFPHPSRVNRWYNAEENRLRAGRFLRDALVRAREEGP